MRSPRPPSQPTARQPSRLRARPSQPSPPRTDPSMPAYFPVALDLQGRRCLVVGGGSVAQRKVDALLDAGAQVLIVAPRISAEIEGLGLLRAVEIRLRQYQPDDLDGVFIVVAATDDRETNARVAADARQRGILVNAVDDP